MKVGQTWLIPELTRYASDQHHEEVYRVRVNKGGFVIMVTHGYGFTMHELVTEWLERETSQRARR